MQHEINPVIWVLGSGENKIVENDGNGNIITFGEDIIRKSYDHDLFSLFDIGNDLLYSIDLSSGEIIINGLPISIAKEVDGRMFQLSNLKTDYRKGLIQYKESYPMKMFIDTVPKPMTFNIGYKIDVSDLDLFYFTESFKSKIIRFKFILSIRKETMKPTISISITEERTFKNGSVSIVKV